MKKMIQATCLLLLLSVSAIALAHQEQVRELVRSTVDIYQGVIVTLNGTELAEPAIIYNDRAYLPVRAVAEGMNLSVAYDADEKEVSIQQISGLGGASDPVVLAEMGTQLARIRSATAKYLDVKVARADGFQQSSGMIPDHGYHFIKTLNILSSLDLEKPAGLVYIHHDETWQLVAVEYTAIFRPSNPLVPGGQWTLHEAACHYEDGNELLEGNPLSCPRKHPRTDSPYITWHPSAWTFHVWAWYPNPSGIAAATNPLLFPYNVPGVDVESHHH